MATENNNSAEKTAWDKKFNLISICIIAFFVVLNVKYYPLEELSVSSMLSTLVTPPMIASYIALAIVSLFRAKAK